jgi:hypothetical protein
MNPPTISRALVAAAICALLFSSCERIATSSSADDGAGLTGGTLVFEDDFSGESVGPHWSTGFEGWRQEDGELLVQGARNDALWLSEPLPERFRVTFTARSDSEEGDLKFEILGDGQTHESGYVGIFGGWNNRLNIIARLDEHGDDRHVGAFGQSVEPGRTYEMAVVRTDHRLRWYVDGEHFLTYDDPEPLGGEGHRHFGFNNWNSPVRFGALRVYDLSSQ